MKNTLTGLVQLSRYREYTATVIITTLLGFLISEVHFFPSNIPKMTLVALANFLCVAFSFMINDVEDAVDDARDTEKSLRNPVSSGMLSPAFGYIFSFLAAFISAVIYYQLGTLPFWLGTTSLALAGLYSWRIFRLKAIPVIDLISHGLMLAGLQLLCAYFVVVPYHGIDANWVAPLIFVVAISIRGQLYNQIRDFECDKKAGIKHTTSIVGIRVAKVLMLFLMLVAGTMLVYIFYIKIIPIWLLVTVIPLGFFLTRNSGKNTAVLKSELIQRVQKPALILGIVSLSIWIMERFIR